MKTEILRVDHPVALRHAQDVLNHGGLVVFPTDTVYGLAVSIGDEDSVERLYITKGRNSERAVAVLIGEIEDLSKVVRLVNVQGQRLVDRFWPGPLTIILPARVDLPRNLAPNQTIGVRMPDHAFVRTLLRQSGPLVVSSANLTGKAFTRSAQEVLKQLEGRVHLVLDGGITPGGVPSTVVDCTGEMLAIVRKGPIPDEEIYLTAGQGF